MEHLVPTWAQEVAGPLRCGYNLFDSGRVRDAERSNAFPGEDQSELPQQKWWRRRGGVVRGGKHGRGVGFAFAEGSQASCSLDQFQLMCAKMIYLLFCA